MIKFFHNHVRNASMELNIWLNSTIITIIVRLVVIYLSETSCYKNFCIFLILVNGVLASGGRHETFSQPNCNFIISFFVSSQVKTSEF